MPLQRHAAVRLLASHCICLHLTHFLVMLSYSTAFCPELPARLGLPVHDSEPGDIHSQAPCKPCQLDAGFQNSLDGNTTSFEEAIHGMKLSTGVRGPKLAGL